MAGTSPAMTGKVGLPCTTSNGFAKIRTHSIAVLTARTCALNCGSRLIAIDERRRATIRGLSRRKRAETRPPRKSAKPRKQRTKRRAQALMAEVDELKACDPGDGSRREGRLQGAGRRAVADPQPAARRGARRRDEHGNVEHHRFGQSATTPSRRSSISSLARRCAKWTSRRRPSCRVRVSSC